MNQLKCNMNVMYNEMIFLSMRRNKFARFTQKLDLKILEEADNEFLIIQPGPLLSIRELMALSSYMYLHYQARFFCILPCVYVVIYTYKGDYLS